MARPAKISSDELSGYMRPYLVRDNAEDIADKKSAIKKAMTDRLIKNDAEVAEEISKATGIKIDRNQIVYWRRKYNIRACGDNHGGARYPDYASGYDLVQLLHRMDVHRLSVEWVPGLTGGGLTPAQMECCKKLRAIARKIKKSQRTISDLRDEARKSHECKRLKEIVALSIEKNQENISALQAEARKIAIDYNIARPLLVSTEEEEIDPAWGGGKKTKGGGKVSIQAGQFFAN